MVVIWNESGRQNVHSDPANFITDLYLFGKERVGDMLWKSNVHRDMLFYLCTEFSGRPYIFLQAAQTSVMPRHPQLLFLPADFCFSWVSLCAAVTVSSQLFHTINLTHNSCAHPEKMKCLILRKDLSYSRSMLSFYGWTFIFPIACWTKLTYPTCLTCMCWHDEAIRISK